jgi:hypothetical protein
MFLSLLGEKNNGVPAASGAAGGICARVSKNFMPGSNKADAGRAEADFCYRTGKSVQGKSVEATTQNPAVRICLPLRSIENVYA